MLQREALNIYGNFQKLINKISYEIDNKKISMGIFIDLSKAFDTLNHKILIYKLYRYGIIGILLDWFISYLENIQQYAKICDNTSSKVYTTCGMPQGSILVPLLFILYINDTDI